MYVYLIFIYVISFGTVWTDPNLYHMMPIEYCCFDFNASSKSPANKRPLFISRAIINYNPWQQSDEVNAYKLSDNMALVPGLLILNPTFTKLPGPSAAIFETRMFCFIDPENVIFFFNHLFTWDSWFTIHQHQHPSIHWLSPYAIINQTIKDEGDHLQTDEFLAAASHRSAEETMRKSKPSDLNGGRDSHQTGNPMTGEVSRYPWVIQSEHGICCIVVNASQLMEMTKQMCIIWKFLMVKTSKRYDKLMPFVTDLSPSLIFRYSSTWITKYPSTVLKHVGHLENIRKFWTSLGPNLNWLQSTQLSNPKELCFTRWVECGKATIQRIPWELLKLDWRRVTWKKIQPVGVMELFDEVEMVDGFFERDADRGWGRGSMWFCNDFARDFRQKTENLQQRLPLYQHWKSGINQNYQHWKQMITNKTPSKIMCTYTVPAY